MLYGRRAACAAVEELMAGAGAGRGGSLVVLGEAGSGKSALLDHAAAGHGGRVLRAGGVQSEAELPFAALHQLLRPLLGALPGLVPTQREALRGALELGSAAVGDRFLVSVAVLNLVSEAADERPLLCLVDDAQWIDRPSADVLVFVARRLGTERVAMLMAARESPPGGLPELPLEPLDAEAAGALLRERAALPDTVVARLVTLAGGNPLALRELPASLTDGQLAGREPVDDRLPLPARLERVFSERVRRLPDAVRRLLLVAAAEETGETAVILAAAGVDASTVDAAERAGLVEVGGGIVAFRHPLVRSAAYQIADPADRRAAHRALAACVHGDDRVAWHRAAATAGADEDVADALERSAERAAHRGGHAAAAAALRRAAELSADPAARCRRLVAAADSARRSGRHLEACELLDRAEAGDDDPAVRVVAEHVRATIEADSGNVLTAAHLLAAASERAAAVAPTRALQMLVEAAEAAAYAGDALRSAELGRRAATLPADDKPAGFLSDLLQGMGRVAEGDTAAGAVLLRRAISVAEHLTEPRQVLWAGVAALFVGDEAAGRAWFARAVEQARRSGAVGELPHALEYAAEVDLVTGRYDGAAAHAAEGLRLAGELGQDTSVCRHHATLAYVAALRGAEDECRSHARRALTRAAARGLGLVATTATYALGLLELGLGRSEGALGHFHAMLAAPPGSGSPFFAVMCVPDLVEAAARTGRRDGVEAPLAAFAQIAGPSGSPAARALLRRAQALHGTGETAYAEALDLGRASDRPFDLARTRLAYGEFLRRGKRRAEARAQLREAVHAFDLLGAGPWAERARAELRVTGETARKREPGTLQQLTPQERQIVRLVVEGATNQQAAAQLFISKRTVEYHLHNVFTKLGVSSRTALARLEVP
ncbi:AAA family ATPase [Actinoplanes sp. URMC 104]|uniref:helix-turn-helix transcriptional regulator n=1 Tax=Actinoplanes sp. URMC 104 TaxID=3423409 RepID=UPI003F19EB2E